ncbi:MAG: hypothetical protein UR23_C0042G0005 [Candidatus Roizmanbacteria bacterium GW2011_GWA2_32_13]|uniref:Uncharacterized protein n=1 Tax=Candidatus Roizmanbacteria bacterium GW2011_GWA2_32_13 TaxID=1618475 RepID=A0A0F9YQ36_9BACT|nr:MAG: hypothetical protein UR23_C0042G0005 [Candidatus Roizmanbacteria bacterium GW2011_GWA2_32_13]
MQEPISQPVRVVEKAPGKVERVVTKARELTQKGEEWFKNKWEKVTGKKPTEVRQVLKDIEGADETVLLTDEIEKPNQKVEGTPEEQIFSKPIKSVIESYGGVTGLSGEGSDKIAYNVGTDKVALIHKENVAPKENSAEFYKSQYYLHQILHILMPDNFPQVRMASGNNFIIVDRVPDTEDFIRAKEIKKKLIGTWAIEDETWFNDKTKQIKNLDSFKEMKSLLDDILLPYTDRTGDELALPNNTVVVDGKPISIELFFPHNNISQIIKEDNLFRIISERLNNKQITEKEGEIIKIFYERYKLNVNKCLNEKR